MADGNALDTTANGGGITLKGLTDKTLNWIDATDSWTSNQHVDLSSITKNYKIGGSTVLSYNALGTGITTSYLTSVGTLTSLQVDDININGNIISSTSSPPTDIVINPGGIGRVDFGGSVLTNIQTPNVYSDPSVAATKAYVDAAVPADWILIPDLAHVPLIGNTYQAEVSDRFLVDTLTSGQVTITLPSNPVNGDIVRFIDAKGNFSSTSLIVRRYRIVDTTVGDYGGGVSSLTEVDTYDLAGVGLPTTSDGAGTGLTVRVTTTVLGDVYTPGNTTIEIIDQGDGYATGEEITVAGADIGGGSDLIFVLEMHNILAANSDLEINDANAAFGLIYVESTKNWKYAETTVLPVEITVDVVGNLTGNVISTNTSTTVLNTSFAVAEFTGNVTGDVAGDLEGTADIATTVTLVATNSTNALHYVTFVDSATGDKNVRTDTSLTYNPYDNELTTGRISAPYGITGPLDGNVNKAGALTVSATSGLTISSGSNSILIRSGNSGLRLTAYDNTTGTDEQYAVQVTPGAAPGQRPTTKLYGDVEVANVSPGTNIYGSSFKLPTYDTPARDARTLTLTQLNYGELIYNSTDNKIQAFIDDGSHTAGIWVALH